MDSSNSSSRIQYPLPPGFRFHPSDQELIIHYLKNRVTSSPLPASVIAEVDLYQFDPWELPKKALFGEEEWYFFTPRDRKYPNGARPNRSAASGYWKATGIDKPIFSTCGKKISIGVKKALVFYSGRPPRGAKTDWIMHEYRLLDAATAWKQKASSMRLDDWVLCRVRKKSSAIPNRWEDRSPTPSDFSQTSKGIFWFPDKEHNNPQLSKDYMNNFPLLPYLLNSPKFPIPEPNLITGGLAAELNRNRASSDKEEMELSKSSLDNLFELFKDCSDDQSTSRLSTVTGDSLGARRSQHPENNPICAKKNGGFINPTADNEVNWFVHNFKVGQWDYPVFQL